MLPRPKEWVSEAELQAATVPHGSHCLHQAVAEVAGTGRLAVREQRVERAVRVRRVQPQAREKKVQPG